MKETITQLNQAINKVVNTDRESINWELKPAPDKWSKKEIIGHLIDSAQINLQRFVRCTYEEGFKLTYEQDSCVAAQQYQKAHVNDLLELWRLLNQQMIRVWKNYPANRLQSLCDTSKTSVGLHTVEWLAQDYVRHLNHHLETVYKS